jgi:hypothetical protein
MKHSILELVFINAVFLTISASICALTIFVDGMSLLSYSRASALICGLIISE